VLLATSATDNIDGGADATPTAPGTTTPPKTCTEAGGTCGPTPDLPCASTQHSVKTETACRDQAPCCVPLPQPGEGQCFTAADCEVASALPGRPAAIAQCDGASQRDGILGTCRCTADGAPALGGRCSPRLAADERLLCTKDGKFKGQSGICNGKECPVASVCMGRGEDVEPKCLPIRDRGGLPTEFCLVVNCGDIQCQSGTRCTDASTGTCEL
jgi:hypothetical protein